VCKTITGPLNRVSTILRWQSAVGWRIGGGGGIGVAVFPVLAQQQLRLQQQARRRFSNCAVRYTNDNSNNTGAKPRTTAQRAMAQSQSPSGRVGVAAALAAAGKGDKVKPTLWDEFALRDRVALVSGGNRGLGLEMALVLAEAGCARRLLRRSARTARGRSGVPSRST
jgi:hypothetical protein